MKNFALVLPLILLAGCSSMQGVHPNLKPQASLTTTPTVEFMGDSQMMQLVASANNPLWQCTTCQSTQLSAAVLAEVPQVIALHPDIVVIQTGAYDIVDGIETSRTQPTFGNIEAIVAAFQQAGIPAVISLLPPSSAYDSYYLDEALDLENQAGLIPNLFALHSQDEVTDGINYSQAGLAELEPQFYQEVEGFGLGGQK